MENYWKRLKAHPLAYNLTLIVLTLLALAFVSLCFGVAAGRFSARASTGFEALLGWLYLKGRRDRINALFCAMMEE